MENTNPRATDFKDIVKEARDRGDTIPQWKIRRILIVTEHGEMESPRFPLKN